MKKMEYCDSWFWSDRSPTDILTEAEARARHAKREEYTAVLGGFEHPLFVVEVVNDFVPVSFFDAMFRSTLVYHFEEIEPGRLFMTMAVRRRYCPATDAMVARMMAGRKTPDQPWAQFLADSDRVIEGTSLAFKMDNSVLKQYEHFAAPYDFQESRFQWDTSVLWEPYPEFGCYEHLLKRRSLPWGPGLDDA